MRGVLGDCAWQVMNCVKNISVVNAVMNGRSLSEISGSARLCFLFENSSA